MEDAYRGEVRYINPDTRPATPAFTNVVVVTGPVQTVYIGGQDAVNAAGEIVFDGASHTLQPGANAEIRVLPRTRLVLGLVSDAPSTSGGTPRLRLRTDVKWDLAETAR